MIFAMIENDEKEQVCAVDKAGPRAFLLKDFFQRDLKELCIDSNHIDKVPESMEELIDRFDILWTDDMALFFGSNPELGIALHPENDWQPLKKLEELWSPLEKARGLSLLE